jgi:hypothetical protein
MRFFELIGIPLIGSMVPRSVAASLSDRRYQAGEFGKPFPEF